MNTHCPDCGTHRDAIEGEIVPQADGSWTCARCVRRKTIVRPESPGDRNPVVIRCPVCLGSRTAQPDCKTCSRLGHVRVARSALNVYDPAAPAPQLLTEADPPG